MLLKEQKNYHKVWPKWQKTARNSEENCIKYQKLPKTGKKLKKFD